MSLMYNCTKRHRTNKVHVNYITKKEECGRHHCNAPVVSVEVINRGKVISVTVNWAEIKMERWA